MWSSRDSRALRANDVHTDAQEILQVLEQADVIKERRARLEIHEQIQIAVRVSLAPSD